ncbi:uncharacterized protein LOC120265176 [Dioscorea cayenensis subsp. rotundata]|uniref:Uncharacterized protein LOC120265176 n=1 Tax=Dioscorea cayennensis subsp. rotundata TaxID=55577 RepID=A0AB40BRG9_DIOCR|nr:uncharacterized protein LOC120265176 [Dioscorea cayenensis subsp. rotundata]
MAQCLTCQQVKVEHQRPIRLLQPLPIPEWKWENIAMDFVSGFPKTNKGFDSVWIVVDRLTKSAHFLAIKTSLSLEQLVELYNLKLQGVLVAIVSDRDTRYQASIQMVPYEALYGRRCRSPICWDDVGKRKLLGPKIVQITVEKVHQIRDRLQAAQSQQKSYADNRRRNLEFQVGEHVFLKVAPTKGIVRFGVKSKLSPRFIGLFKILERIGEMAYRLALPPTLSQVHNVFHVSMRRKYVSNPDHVIQFSGFELNSDLFYEE